MKTLTKKTICLFLAFVLFFGIAASVIVALPTRSVRADDGVGGGTLAEPVDITSDVDWKYVAFGQSVDTFFNVGGNDEAQRGLNNVWLDPNFLDDVVADQAYFIPSDAQREAALKNEDVVEYEGQKVLIESRGGKITGGHDGMSFFYTEMDTSKNFKLVAAITPMQFGAYGSVNSTSGTGQVGYGMIGRDTIGEHRQEPAIDGSEELPSPSNMAGIGRYANNRGAVLRDGCMGPAPGTAIGVARPECKTNTFGHNVGDTQIYELERRNEGFFMTVYAVDGETKLVDDALITDSADLVTRIVEDKMYVGFYASRQARILVEDIELYETGEWDGNKTPIPAGTGKQYGEPSVSLKSRSKTTVANYGVILETNYDGTLEIKYDDVVIFDGVVENYEPTRKDISLKLGTNTISYKFTPNDINAPNNDVKEGNFTVTLDSPVDSSSWKHIYAGNVAAGDGNGKDAANCMTIASAVAAVEPGQTIYIVAGDYTSTSMSLSGTKGTLENRVKVEPAPGVSDLKFRNISIVGSYWHLNNFTAGGTVTSRTGTAISSRGDYNIIENCIAEYCTSTGLTINSGGAKNAPSRSWAKYNLVLNCTSRFNQDSTVNNADGFQAQLMGVGNVFRGCIAHHNADDGFDFFQWVDSGASEGILVEDCVAYANGHNGFKLGGEAQPAHHTVKNSVAFDNVMANFSDNFNPGRLTLENCTALDAIEQNFILRDNKVVKVESSLHNSLSIRTKVAGKNDAIAGTLNNSALAVNGYSSIDGYVVTSNDFISLERQSIEYAKEGAQKLNGYSLETLSNGVADGDDIEFYKRDENGDIIWGDFMKVKASSPLAKLGVGALDADPVTLESISAVFNPTEVIKTNTSLDSLKTMLTVNAVNSIGEVETVTGYTLSGALTAGVSTITVTYQGKTTTFNVVVTAAPVTPQLDKIIAVFNPTGTISSDASLDSLKTMLQVNAVMDDGSMSLVTGYTLSGTLTAGSISTITVTYQGKTTTFKVVVEADPVPPVPTPDPGLSAGAAAGISIACTLVVCAGIGFALYWFLIKKKA